MNPKDERQHEAIYDQLEIGREREFRYRAIGSAFREHIVSVFPMLTGQWAVEVCHVGLAVLHDGVIYPMSTFDEAQQEGTKRLKDWLRQRNEYALGVEVG